MLSGGGSTLRGYTGLESVFMTVKRIGAFESPLHSCAIKKPGLFLGFYFLLDYFVAGAVCSCGRFHHPFFLDAFDFASSVVCARSLSSTALPSLSLYP